MRPRTQLLNPRELVILASLVDGPLHGYGIIKAVEDQSESRVRLDPANLYRALRRMRALGWIEEIEGAEEARRRTFALTPSGRLIIAAELRRLERLIERALPAFSSGGAP